MATHSPDPSLAFVRALPCGLGKRLSALRLIGCVRVCSRAMNSAALREAVDIRLRLNPWPEQELFAREMREKLGPITGLLLWQDPEMLERVGLAAIAQMCDQLSGYLHDMTPALGAHLRELVIRIEYECASTLARTVAVSCTAITRLNLGTSLCDWDCMASLSQLAHLTCAQMDGEHIPKPGQNPKPSSITFLRTWTKHSTEHGLQNRMSLSVLSSVIRSSTVLALISFHYPYLQLYTVMEDSDHDESMQEVRDHQQTIDNISTLDQGLVSGLRILSRHTMHQGLQSRAKDAAVQIELSFMECDELPRVPSLLHSLKTQQPTIISSFIVSIWSNSGHDLSSFACAFPNTTILTISGEMRNRRLLKPLEGGSLRCLHLNGMGSLFPQEVQHSLLVMCKKGLIKLRVTDSEHFMGDGAAEFLTAISPQLSVMCFRYSEHHPIVRKVEGVVKLLWDQEQYRKVVALVEKVRAGIPHRYDAASLESTKALQRKLALVVELCSDYVRGGEPDVLAHNALKVAHRTAAKAASAAAAAAAAVATAAMGAEQGAVPDNDM